MTGLQAGDVVCVRQNTLAAKLIRLGAALRDEPNIVNHVAVYHHTDEVGVPWGIEGRPGGVGWVDMRTYLDSKWTINNSMQLKTSTERKIVNRVMESLLKTPYDWLAIGDDTLASLHLSGVEKFINDLYQRHGNNGKMPGHIVCSSAAAYAYQVAKLKYPPLPTNGSIFTVTPADWYTFIIENSWWK